MHKTCANLWCKQAFEVTEDDLAFYDTVSPVFAGKKFAIPPPTLCFQCREQHRLAYRNERCLYRRQCALTGKPMISLYSPEKPYTVYEQSVWWSDQCDPLAYGRDFDFSRPFFEQWQDLSLAAPRLSIHNAKSENAEYTNYSAENRNCYLVVGGLGAEDSYYSYRIFYSKDIVDCYDLYACELCYECLECTKLYASQHCDQCHDSSSLAYCSDCIGCSECLGCIGVRQKKYCILNQQYSEAEYRLESAKLHADQLLFKEKLTQLRERIPVQSVRIINSEDCSGDKIIDSRRCTDCFIIKKSEDLRHCSMGEGNTSCGDCNFFDNSELQWNSSNLEKNYNVLCANLAWYVRDAMYVTSCFHSSHLFGCIGMKKHEYCILNKQYTHAEYMSLVPKIIEHMQETGEWGEYFPILYSPFAYNETVAGEEYPMTREQVLSHHWPWHDSTQNQEQDLKPQGLAITEEMHICVVTGKPFKIIPQERKFYKKMRLPIPIKCPEERHRDRMALRSPRRLWNRECATCQKPIATSYAPERQETVVCEECYLKEVY